MRLISLVSRAIGILIVGSIFPRLLLAQCPNPTSTPRSEYLSDHNRGYHFLEKMQVEAYKSASVRRPAPVTVEMTVQRVELEQMKYELFAALSSSANPQEDQKAFDKAWREAAAEWSNELAKMKLTTRCENPMWYELVSGLSRRIEDVVPPKTLASAPHVIFGTLPLAGVNAQTFAVPGDPDDIVVAINEDLFDAAYWIIRDLILTLDWRPRAERGVPWDKDYVMQRTLDPNIQSRFREVLLWYLGRQKSPITWYPMEPRQLRLVITLVTSMEIFALAHEYSHALLHHKYREEVGYSWQQEIAADDMGYLLMLKAQNKSSDKEEILMGFWGAQLMLGVMDILELSKKIESNDELSKKIQSTGKMPVDDPLIMNGAVQCYSAPESQECKTFEKQHYMPNSHPPFPIRVGLIRHDMHETIPDVLLDDNWDFGTAIQSAGMALLADQVSFIAPKSVSRDNPREQEK